METFKDITGDEWAISLNIGEMRRIENRLAELKNDIVITNPPDVTTEIQDPYNLADLLFVVLEPEAKKRNITSADFGYRLAGDAIRDAKRAFLEEYANFFPEESQRQKIRTLATTANRIGAEILDKAIDKRADAMEVLKERVLQLIETTEPVKGFGAESSNSAVSQESDSTPTPSS